MEQMKAKKRKEKGKGTSRISRTFWIAEVVGDPHAI
jgi:hypothetical protein